METAQNIIEILTENIEFEEEFGKESQVRLTGIANDHVEALAASISEVGQEVPISVEVIPGKENFYKAVDGDHRCKAIKKINEDRPESEKMKVKAQIKHYGGSAERLVDQVKMNHHLPTKSSTLADLKTHFTTLIKTENVCGDLERFSDDKAALKCIKDYVKSVIPGHKDVAKIANHVWSHLPNRSRRTSNWTAEEMREHIRAILKVNVKKSGDIVGGVAYYYTNQQGSTPYYQWFFSMRKKLTGAIPAGAIVVLSIPSIGGTAKSLESSRDSLIEGFKELNEFIGQNVVSTLCFMPQIRKHEDAKKNPDDFRKLIEVDVRIRQGGENE